MLIIFTIVIVFIYFLIFGTILNIKFERMKKSEDKLYKNGTISEELEVNLVDVGQGDGIIITYKDKVIVIDCGTILHQNTMKKYLESLNVKRINALIITHPHQDHFGGLDSILSNFKVDKIYTTEIDSKVDKSIFERFHLFKYNLIVSTYNRINGYSKIVPIKNKNGKFKSIKFGDVKLNFLGPLKNYENFNNNSIVCKLIYKDISMLFTGDIQAEAEHDLVETYGEELDVNVLKISHHGSHTSSTDEFLEVTNPEIALISCAIDNSFWHPHHSVAKRLEENNITLYRTDEDDSIVLVTDGYTIETENDEGDYLCGKEISSKS